MALRISIGAGRRQLVQQPIVGEHDQSGRAVGLAFAALTVPAIVSRLTQRDAPTWLDVRFDWRTLSFLIGLSAV